MSYSNYLKELEWYDSKILSAGYTLEEKRLFVIEMDELKSKYSEYEETRKSERRFSSTTI